MTIVRGRAIRSHPGSSVASHQAGMEPEQERTPRTPRNALGGLPEETPPLSGAIRTPFGRHAGARRTDRRRAAHWNRAANGEGRAQQSVSVRVRKEIQEVLRSDVNARERLVRASLALDGPADASQRREDLTRLCAPPCRHASARQGERKRRALPVVALVIDSVSHDAKGERFNVRDRGFPRRAVAHDARQLGDLGDPSTVLFPVYFDLVVHGFLQPLVEV